MIKRLIIFLIRKRLGLNKYQSFRFKGQKSKFDYYFFDDTCLMKNEFIDGNKYISRYRVRKSSVSLNWLLNDKCEIVKVNDNEIAK